MAAASAAVDPNLHPTRHHLQAAVALAATLRRPAYDCIRLCRTADAASGHGRYAARGDGAPVAVAVWAIVMFAPWQDWLNGVLGAWLVIAPWVLGFGSLATAAWNHVSVGLLVLAFAAWELWDVRQRATA
jgi:hypothetical protein